MKTAIARVGAGGRVDLPVEFRREPGLKIDDFVSIIIVIADPLLQYSDFEL